MYPGSSFYGIKETLLKYAKLPSFFPLPIAVQHGWQRKAHNFEASTSPPEIWVWSERIAKEVEQFYPKARIRVAGSFFCYVDSVKSISLVKGMSRGSICIPPHSSKLAKSVYSAEEFASKLNDLDETYKPIRVMLYYLDRTDETVAAYEKYGFDVVTNGELTSSTFIHNFINHVKDKEYCIFSELGSGVFYSRHCGLKPIQLDVEHENVNKGCVYTNPQMIKESYEMDEKFVTQLEDELFVSSELGTNKLLSSSQMRWLIIRHYFSFLFFKRVVRGGISKVINMLGIKKSGLKK